MEQVELVIRVSEWDYNYIKSYGVGAFVKTAMINDYAIEKLSQYTNAIKDGTPLPKGHGALKDADALKKKATMCPTVGNAETLLLDISDVENAPTIIEADKEGVGE